MDKSDKLKNLIRPCNNHHLRRDRTPTLDNLPSSHNPEKEVRIIPGPAGIVQLAKRRKQADVSEGGQECVISTQEYIRKVVEDVGDIKSFINNGKVDQVVAIIKSCTPNALGDLTITLKDFSSSILGAIHHKIINEKGEEERLRKEREEAWELGLNGYVSDSFSDSEEERFRIEAEEDWEHGWCGYVLDSFTDTD
ncbi:hypothetical protein CTI12_AA315050 [Artemisia annua]|uniref:Homologous recombination OB-fold protein OB-fold domain-containing protein n=1 Tax=Artemisia annua TaxID=35608 RepID=A0A2U1N2I6_ARTAN|nr:hypothetical protein CTI12_AA315050 [Artemisia annua]